MLFTPKLHERAKVKCVFKSGGSEWSATPPPRKFEKKIKEKVKVFGCLPFFSVRLPSPDL